MIRKPTLDILDAISPEYDQYQNMLPIIARHKEYTTKFSLSNQIWDDHYSEISSLTFNWAEFKYSDVVDRVLRIDDIVPDTIGVYLFIVKPHNLINDLPKYVYYVGIAGANGSGRTLKERLKDYFATSQVKKRDAVKILIFKHYRNLYISYTSVVPPSTMSIEDIEKSLIGFYGTHLLANRDDIPVALQPHTKAFNI